MGYAIDRAGGDIFAIGSPPEEDAWETGHIKDQGLSASGNYRKFVEANGKTIGHILDPRTGASASTVLSGTVIAKSAIEADALSTGLFILGVEKAREILAESTNLQFVAVVQKSDREEIIKLLQLSKESCNLSQAVGTHH